MSVTGHGVERQQGGRAGRERRTSINSSIGCRCRTAPSPISGRTTRPLGVVSQPSWFHRETGESSTSSEDPSKPQIEDHLEPAA